MDLVFTKTTDSPGAPLQWNTLGERQFAPLCRKAGVRIITIHGLRHCCATLCLAAGVPAHVVQHRLGHSSVVMTLSVHSHALPTQQQDAATKLAALLHTGTT